MVDARDYRARLFFKINKVRHVEGDSEDDVTNILLSEVLMVA